MSMRVGFTNRLGDPNLQDVTVGVMISNMVAFRGNHSLCVASQQDMGALESPRSTTQLGSRIYGRFGYAYPPEAGGWRTHQHSHSCHLQDVPLPCHRATIHCSTQHRKVLVSTDTLPPSPTTLPQPTTAPQSNHLILWHMLDLRIFPSHLYKFQCHHGSILGCGADINHLV